MERFRGSLAKYPLSMLVPTLSRTGRSTGTLVLTRGAVRREFRLRMGTLVGVSSNVPREHLAQVLVDEGLLTLPQAASAFAVAYRARLPLGRYLVMDRLVSPVALTEALTRKAREAFFDCYEWRAGEVEVRPGPLPTEAGVDVCLELWPLHQTALDRRAEWHSFFGTFTSLDLTFQVARGALTLATSPEDELLLGWAADGRTLEELFELSPEGRLETARRLLALSRHGDLTPREREVTLVGHKGAALTKLIRRAWEHFHAGEFTRCRQIAHRALQQSDDPEAHALLKESELRLALSLCDALLGTGEDWVVEELPSPPPLGLTADDIYLHQTLRNAPRVRDALRTAAMGETAAYLCVSHLVEAGLLHPRAG
jgi:hypothetical protein